MLVVGGGPAGAAAAVYAARGIRTGVVAERFGSQVNDTLGIENFISVLEPTAPSLPPALEAHAPCLRRGHHEPAARRAIIPRRATRRPGRCNWTTAPRSSPRP